MAPRLVQLGGIALLLQLLAMTVTCVADQNLRGNPGSAAKDFAQHRLDTATTTRQLLATLPNISSLPVNVTAPPLILQNVTAQNLTAQNLTAQNLTALNLTATPAYNLSSINQTLIISQLKVPANLTELLGLNQTNDFVRRLVNQTLPLVLACSSNTTSQLMVCYKTWQAVFNKTNPNVTEDQYRFTVFVNNTQPIIAQEMALVRFFTTANKTQIVELFLADELPPQITTLLNSTTLLGFSQYNDRTLSELGRRFSGSIPDDPPGLNSTLPGVNGTLPGLNSTLPGLNTTLPGVNSTLPGVNSTRINGTLLGARRKLLANSSPVQGKANWIKSANDIRDQGQCGYCWVFAVTGNLEITNNIALNPSVKYAFSEEEIIDCLGAECDSGGFAQWSSWVPKNKAWASNSQIPYRGENGLESQCPKGAPGNWFTNLVQCSYNWNDWKKVLDVQPTLFYVYSSTTAFMNYQGNTILAGQCSSQTSDHVMVAVGYDTATSDAGDKYEYIIFRNSWGKTWGAAGYGKYAMTKNGKDLNLCATTSKGIVFHSNAGIPMPTLSGKCQSLSLTNRIQQ